ncbi:MAG: NUDIX domain-containing protein [Acidobacteriota bacterium]|nr:NUDIX domain-containing protein [Acidobacteriota bacterium]
MIANGTSGEARAFLRTFSWDGWAPEERATLLFVVSGGRILLIEKHRGLGQGKVNGPGGRLERGESPRAAAVREAEEEIRIRPTGIRPAGELRFQFVDGYSIHVYVFRADGFAGEPESTVEATPLWADLESIPYERMWEDDAVWLPLLLRRQPFSGRFVFDGERMLTNELDLLAAPAFAPGEPPPAREAEVFADGRP